MYDRAHQRPLKYSAVANIEPLKLSPMAANTLLSIELDPKALAQLDFPQLCERVIEKLSEIKTWTYRGPQIWKAHNV
jgi:hypothetical protein